MLLLLNVRLLAERRPGQVSDWVVSHKTGVVWSRVHHLAAASWYFYRLCYNLLINHIALIFDRFYFTSIFFLIYYYSRWKKIKNKHVIKHVNKHVTKHANKQANKHAGKHVNENVKIMLTNMIKNMLINMLTKMLTNMF